MRLIIALLLFLPAVSHAALSVQLSAENRSAVALTNTPLKFGVPIARSQNLTSISSLGITGHDAQFRVLSRYDGTPSDGTKPIRSVLVDFQDSINASTTDTYTLTDSGSGTAAGTLASDQTTYWQISTGAAVFQISKTSGNIFESVVVGSDTLVSSPTADKWAIVYSGTTYYSTPDSSEIEENGPLRCVVKVEGHFEDGSSNTLYPPDTVKSVTPNTPIKYTLRYYAYKNKSYVKLQATFRNENLGWSRAEARRMHNMSITEMYLDTTLSLDASGTVAFDGYTDTTSWSDTYELFQDETADGSTKSYSWGYTIEKNAGTVDTGTQYDSYMDVRDASGGLMVAERYFYQSHPSAMSAIGKKVRFSLIADNGSSQRVLGGMWKTQEILYYFHGTDTTFDDELVHIKQRPLPRPTAEYIASTNFFWGMLPGTITTSDGHQWPGGGYQDQVLADYDSKQKANFNDSYITMSLSKNILNLRDERAIPYSNDGKYGTWYGWLLHGAMPRWTGQGYHNQHYDWSFLAITTWLRWEDEWQAWDYGQELVTHLADVIVVHDPDATYAEMDEGYYMHGGQRYEDWAYTHEYDDYHVGMSAVHGGSHFWTKGMVMQYLLTGEYHYMDSLEDCWEHSIRVRSTANVAKEELRHSMRLMDALIHAYHLTGNTTYLDEAWAYWNGNLAVYEGGNCINYRQAWTCTSDETSGYLHTSPPTADDDMAPSGDAWLSEHMVKLLLALEDAGAAYSDKATSLEAYLIRNTDWLRYSAFLNDDFLASIGQGVYRNGYTEYTPIIQAGYWDDEAGAYGTPSAVNVIFLQPYADLLAWRYTRTGDAWWLNMARQIYKDSLWYEITALGVYLPVKTQLPSIGVFVGENSGLWKEPKKYTRPSFYKRVEAGLESVGAPTCGPLYLNHCDTDGDCTAAGGYWYDGSCSSVPEPTCSDGILNGDEDGIDCGGSCSPCVAEPTCSDGIKNGDETGVDCGGSCPESCGEPTPPTTTRQLLYIQGVGFGKTD